MKHILSLFLVALMSIASAQACVKKAPSFTSPLTILVMDTTQALLSDAQIQVGKTVYRTSWDGRVVLTPEQLKGVSKMLVSCDGHEQQKIVLSDALTPVLNVQLIPVKRTKPRRTTLTGIRRRGGEETAVLYCTSEAVAKRADYMVTGAAVSNAVPATAGSVTAGEVNDFAKWQLWNPYLQTTQKYQKTWGIVPQQRYTVQVMNKAGYPVVNYPVQITDDKGNTLFQTLTDNTGKAELWGKEGHETLIVDDPCEAPEGVDVVFVFDATGSMGDELRYLQAEMKDVIARAKDATGGLAIRTGAVVYRDHGDEYVTRLSRLTEDIAVTQAFIDKQYASGGGDYPEAVPEALMAALNSTGWSESARARIAFLILDAPCHEDSATLALLHDQVLNAAALGVRLVPVVCSGIDDKAEFLLRAIALTTNGTSFFLTDDSGIGLPHHKPTTDTLIVEHLNDMMVRTIVEFSAMPSCEESSLLTLDSSLLTLDSFIPNPFDPTDLENGEVTIPHGDGILYIVDISGKLITIVEGSFEDDPLSIINHQSSIVSRLPIGVYFVKAFINGQWHTRKFLIQ